MSHVIVIESSPPSKITQLKIAVVLKIVQGVNFV